MMHATLQVDGQFGEDGPGAGDRCVIVEIRKIDGDFWAQCVFPDRYMFFNVKLEHLMTAHTENTETYWSTRP